MNKDFQSITDIKNSELEIKALLGVGRAIIEYYTREYEWREGDEEWLKSFSRWLGVNGQRINLVLDIPQNLECKEVITLINDYSHDQLSDSVRKGVFYKQVQKFIDEPNTDTAKPLAACFEKYPMWHINYFELNEQQFNYSSMDMSIDIVKGHTANSNDLTFWGHVLYSQKHLDVLLKSIKMFASKDEIFLFKNFNDNPMCESNFNIDRYTLGQKILLFQSIPSSLLKAIKDECVYNEGTRTYTHDGDEMNLFSNFNVSLTIMGTMGFTDQMLIISKVRNKLLIDNINTEKKKLSDLVRGLDNKTLAKNDNALLKI